MRHRNYCESFSRYPALMSPLSTSSVEIKSPAGKFPSSSTWKQWRHLWKTLVWSFSLFSWYDNSVFWGSHWCRLVLTIRKNTNSLKSYVHLTHEIWLNYLVKVFRKWMTQLISRHVCMLTNKKGALLSDYDSWLIAIKISIVVNISPHRFLADNWRTSSLAIGREKQNSAMINSGNLS